MLFARLVERLQLNCFLFLEWCSDILQTVTTFQRQHVSYAFFQYLQ